MRGARSLLVVFPLALACGGDGDEATSTGAGAGSAGAGSNAAGVAGATKAGAAGAAGSGVSGFPVAGGGQAGTTTAGSSTAGSSTAGSSTAGSSTAGSSTAGSSTAGSSTAGSATAGSGTAGSGTAGSGTAGSGTAGSGTAGCPVGPPPGSAAKRFDVATLNCAVGGSCTGSEDKCFCAQDFDALNVAPAHFLAVGTDQNKAKIWGAGNFQAFYVDDLNTAWPAGGTPRANAIMDSMKAAFPCGEPTYVVLNEISASLWPTDASYRDFVVEVAKELRKTYGKTPIVAAPFAKPGANGAWWADLAAQAFVGAEVYLSGKEVNANGNAVSWCAAQYQASIDAYVALGVPKNRLMLFEHFGHTDASVGFGRAGVSFAGWKNAVTARATALQGLGLAGFLSYGWAGNAMHATEAERLEVMALYTSLPVP